MNNDTKVNEIDEAALDNFFQGIATTAPTVDPNEPKPFDQVDPTEGLVSGNEPITISLVDDDDDTTDPEPATTDEPVVEEPTKPVVKETVKPVTTTEEEEVEALTVINQMIESGTLLGFEDQNLESTEDLVQLIQANLDHARQQPTEEIRDEFFSKLPEEVRILSDFAAKGARPDQIKKMFGTFAKSEQISTLSTDTIEGQKQILREYYNSIQLGTEEEINEEITTWEDLDRLEEKAEKFKPKLEAGRQKEIEAQIKLQEEQTKQNILFQQQLTDGIKDALSAPTLINLKLPKAERTELVKSLTEYRHKSRTGVPLNDLGAVLERISVTEPDPKLLAELTYFATNPDKFIANLTEKIKQVETGKTVKKLKTRTVTVNNPKDRNKTKEFRPFNNSQ